MYIDKINNIYYNSNANPMPCNFLDLAISPRINSKCLYFAENYDKKTKLYVHNYFNYLNVYMPTQYFDPNIISNYNSRIDIIVSKKCSIKEKRIKVNFVASTATVTLKFNEMLYINDDEVLEVMLADYVAYTSLINNFYTFFLTSKYLTDNIECCRSDKSNKRSLVFSKISFVSRASQYSEYKVNRNKGTRLYVPNVLNEFVFLF
jgi:hypothetical protein